MICFVISFVLFINPVKLRHQLPNYKTTASAHYLHRYAVRKMPDWQEVESFDILEEAHEERVGPRRCATSAPSYAV